MGRRTRTLHGTLEWNPWPLYSSLQPYTVLRLTLPDVPKKTTVIVKTMFEYTGIYKPTSNSTYAWSTNTTPQTFCGLYALTLYGRIELYVYIKGRKVEGDADHTIAYRIDGKRKRPVRGYGRKEMELQVKENTDLDEKSLTVRVQPAPCLDYPANSLFV